MEEVLQHQKLCQELSKITSVTMFVLSEKNPMENDLFRVSTHIPTVPASNTLSPNGLPEKPKPESTERESNQISK